MSEPLNPYETRLTAPIWRCPTCWRGFPDADKLNWHREHEHIPVLENAEIERLRAIIEQLAKLLQDASMAAHSLADHGAPWLNCREWECSESRTIIAKARALKAEA